VRPVLSDDEEFFRATTARFLDEFSPPAKLRALRDDPTGFERDYWRRGAELGWISLLVSEANGGGSISGSGLVDLTLVAYEFGTHAAPGPLVATNVVASALSASGTHSEVLTSLMAGTAIATWCGSGALAMRVEGDEYVLDGVARPVESALVADHLLVTVRSSTGISQVLVPATAHGVSIAPMHTVDLTRRFDVVTFDGVRVPLGALVTEGQSALDRQLLTALVLCAAESVGAMQRAFDMTLAWTFDRYSFGRPLAAYQAIKHRFADMKAWLEASHAITDAAASAVSADEPDANEKARAAMSFIGDYGSKLMQDCVHLHGGLGVTFEHDIHLFLRRHTLNRTLFGTPSDHRQAIADILVQREAQVA
jgi:alkylation response protein AidB-like acyl-CoA dehydrogenase